MTWTVLRATGFYQNNVPGFAKRIFNTVWRYSVGETPLQLVSTRDIGWYGVEAPIKLERYKDRTIGLAGDEMTFAHFDAAWLMMWALSDCSAMFQ